MTTSSRFPAKTRNNTIVRYINGARAPGPALELCAALLHAASPRRSEVALDLSWAEFAKRSDGIAQKAHETRLVKTASSWRHFCFGQLACPTRQHSRKRRDLKIHIIGQVLRETVRLNPSPMTRMPPFLAAWKQGRCPQSKVESGGKSPGARLAATRESCAFLAAMGSSRRPATGWSRS